MICKDGQIAGNKDKIYLVGIFYIGLKIFSHIHYGNIVNWNKAKWNVTNMQEIFTKYSKICHDNSNNDIVFLPSTEGFIHQNVDPICKKLKASAYVEDLKSKQEAVASIAAVSPYS